MVEDWIKAISTVSIMEKIILGGMLYGESRLIESGLVTDWSNIQCEELAQCCINAHDAGDCESEEAWEIRLFAYISGELQTSSPFIDSELFDVLQNCKDAFDEWSKD